MSANLREVISEDTMLKLAHNPGWTMPHLAFWLCEEHNQSTKTFETIYYIKHNVPLLVYSTMRRSRKENIDDVPAAPSNTNPAYCNLVKIDA